MSMGSFHAHEHMCVHLTLNMPGSATANWLVRSRVYVGQLDDDLNLLNFKQVERR